MMTTSRSTGSRRRRPLWRAGRRPRGVPALGYACAPGGAALDGPEVEAQRLEIESACARLGLELVDLVRDQESDQPGAEGRPGLSYALERIDAGEATCLIVSDLERLSRRVPELAALVDRLERARVRLIAIDVGLDTATPGGRVAVTRHAAADRAEAAERAADFEPGTAPPQPVSAEAEPEPAEAEPEPVSAEAEPDPAEGEPEPVSAEAEPEPAEAQPPPDAAVADHAGAADRAPPVESAGPTGEAGRATEPEPAAGGEPTADAEQEREATIAGVGAGGGTPASVQEAVRALGYASVPPDGGRRQLAAQQREIVRRAHRLGLRLVEVVRDREPKTGKALDRAGLSYLIERLAAGDATCVIVSGLERLSRSVAELGTIVEWLEENEVRLVAVDLDLDTASQSGRSTARALASVAGWERERLVDRTRKGLAAARAKRRAAPGPSASPDWEAIKERIAAMRTEGMTLQAIADKLNREGVPTQRGGSEWRPSSVQTAAGYRRPPRPRKVDELPKVDRASGAEGGDPNEGHDAGTGRSRS
jgi:DNA invertase Pin-like site-specific DNA recombinase